MPTTINVETKCLARLLQGLSATDANQAFAKGAKCPRRERNFRLTVSEDPNSKKGQYEIREKLTKFLGNCSVCGKNELSAQLLPFDIPYIVEPTDTSIDIMEC